MAQKIIFTKPCQVITEGYADTVFLRRLAIHRGLGPHVGAFRTSKDPMINASGCGRSGYADTLDALSAEIAFFDVVNGIVLLADNDDDPKGRFDDVVTQVKKAGYPIPTKPEEIVSGKVQNRTISLTIFMVPSAGTPGNLDSLLLDSLPNDSAMQCAAALLACAAADMAGWGESKKAEAKLRAALCCSYARDPGRELSHILFERKRCPFDFSHKAFDHVETFLRRFLAHVGAI